MADRSPARSSLGDFPKSPMRDKFLDDLGSTPKSRTRSKDVSRSPLRETKTRDRLTTWDGDDVDVKSSMRDIDLTEFNGGFPKSPMRDRFLNDLGSVPNSSMRSPMRKKVEGSFIFDGIDKSPVMRQRGMSKSPIREGNVCKSPMRERRNAAGLDGVNKSPARSMVGEFPEFDGNEDAEGKKLTVKSSFNAWLTNNENTQQPDDVKYSGRRTRRDQVGLGLDDISEGKAPLNDPIHGTNPRKEMSYQGRFRGEDIGGYSKSRPTIYHSAPQTDGVGLIHGNKKTAPNYHREPRRSSESSRGAASIHDLAMERAELLRRYEELSNQLGNLEDTSVGFTDGYSEDGVRRFRPRPEQQFVSGRGVRRDSYFSNSRSPVHNTGDVYGYRISTQMTKGPHPGLKPPVQRRFHDDSHESYMDEAEYHHASCSCSLCYTNDWRGHRRSANLTGNSRSSRSMNLDRYDHRHYDPRMAHTGPRKRQSQLAHRNPKICLPIDGGPPFILCHKCFRVLNLPRKVMIKRKKNKYLLKCGACSAVGSVDPQSKSFTPFSEKKYTDSVDVGLVKGLKESSLEEYRNSYDATSTNIGSFDFDAMRNSFQSIDSETSEGSKVRKFGPNLAQNLPPFSPSSSRSSKEEFKEDRVSSEVPSKISLVPPPPGSPLRGLHNPSTYFRRIQAGEVIIGTEEERRETEEDESLESFTENTVNPTEMDVQDLEVPPTNFSQDPEPEDIPPEEDEDGKNKNAQSNETSSISSRSGEVYVNGQLISQDLAKMAEKYAGPIQPGEYWYDSKAGFWGPMGYRCMGIIPPSIQEFRFSMPANCSGGDTTIYINGRELHRRDVEVLGSRGLPATRNKRYSIDFYGRVIDEQSYEFVASLGKLAPTVEREQLGFGMKIPQNLHD